MKTPSERCTCGHMHDDHARLGGFCLFDNCECETFTQRASLPNVFDCGCSHLKVRLGKCDVYDENGNLRTEGTTHV